MKLTFENDIGEIEFEATYDRSTGDVVLKIHDTHDITNRDIRFCRYATAQIIKSYGSDFTRTTVEEPKFDDATVSRADLNP